MDTDRYNEIAARLQHFYAEPSEERTVNWYCHDVSELLGEVALRAETQRTSDELVRTTRDLNAVTAEKDQLIAALRAALSSFGSRISYMPIAVRTSHVEVTVLDKWAALLAEIERLEAKGSMSDDRYNEIAAGQLAIWRDEASGYADIDDPIAQHFAAVVMSLLSEVARLRAEKGALASALHDMRDERARVLAGWERWIAIVREKFGLPRGVDADYWRGYAACLADVGREARRHADLGEMEQ